MLFVAALSAVLLIPAGAMAAQAGATSANPAKKKSAASAKVEAAPAPSTQEIADARAKGLVWVNLGTRVYHKDGDFYGKTKRGKFMSEDDAKKAGFHEAKLPTAKKTTSAVDPKRATKDSRDTSGTDSSEATHRSPVPAKPPKQ
jgi:hypothetical protein